MRPCHANQVNNNNKQLTSDYAVSEDTQGWERTHAHTRTATLENNDTIPQNPGN